MPIAVGCYADRLKLIGTTVKVETSRFAQHAFWGTT
jgi:hypothetical protein